MTFGQRGVDGRRCNKDIWIDVVTLIMIFFHSDISLEDSNSVTIRNVFIF